MSAAKANCLHFIASCQDDFAVKVATKFDAVGAVQRFI